MENTTTIYDKATLLFPNSENNTKFVLLDVFNFFGDAARPSSDFQLYLSIFGIVPSLFHIFILSNKAMRTSSIISIMIGVGIFDLIAMISTIISSKMMFEAEGMECTPPVSLFVFHVFWVFIVIRDVVRRSSTWLGVLMALIRFVVMKFGARPNFRVMSRFSFGFCAFAFSLVSSIPFSIVYYFKYQIVEDGVWNSGANCSIVFPPTPIVTQRLSPLFKIGVFGKFYMLFTGLVSKILPCIFLPLLTIFLVLELRRVDKVRKSSNTSSFGSTEKTTYLVIFMTITFFISELPIGIVSVCQVVYTDLGYLYLATYVTLICNAIFTINATLHSLICFSMSKQYRSTVAKVLGVKTKTTMVRF